jgi:hypothetical protein
MTGEAAMQAHVVLAHPEPLSFNAHLAELARRTLEANGWQVTVSDLYAMGFDPLEGPRHYASRGAPERFDPQAEQRHASSSPCSSDPITRCTSRRSASFGVGPTEGSASS